MFFSTPVSQFPAEFGGQQGYYSDLLTTQSTGLTLLGHRYYDSGTGRFINRDPIGTGGGPNVYGFCGNNPINESDPEGTDWLDVTSDYSAGFGDFISAGLTRRFRQRFGYDDIVDKKSSAYSYGTDTGIAYVAVDTVVGGVTAVGTARNLYKGYQALRAAGTTEFGVTTLTAVSRAIKGGLAYQVRSSGAVQILMNAKNLRVFEAHPEDISRVFEAFNGEKNFMRSGFWKHVLPHEHTYELPNAPAQLNANWRTTFKNLHAIETKRLFNPFRTLK